MKKSKAAAWMLLGALSLAGFLVMTAHAYSVATGKFVAVAMDTSAARTIDTGLTHVRSLTIVVFDPRSPGVVAYTTDQIQAERPGFFLNDRKWDKGLSIAGGTFTVNHALFKRPGITYYWEARGD